MILFSCFLQSAEATTFALVPFVNDEVKGIITGITLVGGNIFGVMYGLLLLSQKDLRVAFIIMAISILLISFLSFLLKVGGETIMGERLYRIHRKTKKFTDNEIKDHK